MRLEVANRLLGWDNAVLFQFQTGAIRRESPIPKPLQVCLFQFQTGAIRRIQRLRGIRVRGGFQFQTGAIRSNVNNLIIRGEDMFQFQTGAIRRLSKINIDIILYPYSSCQVNFYFYQIREPSAVDL